MTGELASAYADDARSQTTGRVLEFPPWAPIAAGTTSPTVNVRVKSDRSTYVRLVAMRGGLKGIVPFIAFTGLELANLTLRLQINGQSDFATNGVRDVPAEFDGLFTAHAQWYWFSTPSILRVGTKLSATVSNTLPIGEGVPALIPYLMLRIVDETDAQYWRALYQG